jgi:hypothetical protein
MDQVQFDFSSSTTVRLAEDAPPDHKSSRPELSLSLVSRILAVDWGARRVGLAVSDPTGLIAARCPRSRCGRGSRRVGDPRNLPRGEVVRIVVGLPLRLDGSHGGLAEFAEARAPPRNKARFGRAVGRAHDLAPGRAPGPRAGQAHARQKGRGRPCRRPSPPVLSRRADRAPRAT